jgi:hypothetical protein
MGKITTTPVSVQNAAAAPVAKAPKAKAPTKTIPVAPAAAPAKAPKAAKAPKEAAAPAEPKEPKVPRRDQILIALKATTVDGSVAMSREEIKEASGNDNKTGTTARDLAAEGLVGIVKHEGVAGRKFHLTATGVKVAAKL